MSAVAQRGTLAPLPGDYRRGLIVLTVFSFLSFLTTALLWLFITYKLLIIQKGRRAERKKRKAQQQRQQQVNTSNINSAVASDLPDLSLGSDAPATGATGFARIQQLDGLAAKRVNQSSTEITTKEHEVAEQDDTSNPFPILIYNLLLADMMEALAYGLSIYWVAVDGIFAPSSVCWAQGWLGSTSNLAASLFLSIISVTTFCTVGLGYKPPPWTIYTCIACLWIFDFGVNGAGVRAADHNPAVPGESFFMRANVWCWISTAYDPWRLWAHYFWVIVSIVLTISLYSFVFATLWRQKRSCRHLPEKKALRSSGAPYETIPQQGARQPSGYHPAFLAYPFIYIACSVPLVIGRITSLIGVDLGTAYFAFAGSVLAANGFFNSILWISTIVFSAPQDRYDAGLDKFAFLRTPVRNYGNAIIISGPASRRVPREELQSSSSDQKEWWWWKHGGQRPWGRFDTNSYARHVVEPAGKPAHTPQSLLQGPYIQLDVVTAVSVESAEDVVPVE